MMKNNFTADEGIEMCIFMQYVLNELQRLPQITVAVVDRFAIGGGTELGKLQLSNFF